MSHTEWLRTFVAIYRTGSVTEAANQRSLSQPAISQHLRGLERSVGAPLFTRHRDGSRPTERGRLLYLEVADSLDHLERTLTGLDRGRMALPTTPLRIGASPEVFDHWVLPALSARSGATTATFADEATLHAALERGDLDLVVSAHPAPKRTCVSSAIGEQRFALIAAPQLVTTRPRTPASLARLVAGAPWVSYSNDLPLTRRFWRETLGQPFDGDLRLVAPDLRVVLSAVEASMGFSLMPTTVCQRSLDEGRVVDLTIRLAHFATTTLFASVRHSDVDRPEVAALLTTMACNRPS
jgi:DNA-binding transcriptional LysR family regulator